jgi:hypothetical protein
MFEFSKQEYEQVEGILSAFYTEKIMQNENIFILLSLPSHCSVAIERIHVEGIT